MLSYLPRQSQTASLSLKHQRRAFHFGKWPSTNNPAVHRELRRHHRKLKHKYVDSLNRKLLWLDHPQVKESRDALRRVTSPSWFTNVARYGLRWNRDVESGSRAFSMNSPLLYRSQTVFKHTQFTFNTQPLRQHTGESPQSTYTGASAKSSVTSEEKEKPEAGNSTQQDYIIDPITNRKVPTAQYGSLDKDGSHDATSNPPTPQYQSFSPPNAQDERTPFHSNGTPPIVELDKYAEGEFDDWSGSNSNQPTSSMSHAHPEAQYYVFEDVASRSEEYALNHLPPEETAEEQSDLQQYQSGPKEVASQALSDMNASTPGVQELQDELSQYKPFMHQEDSVGEDLAPRPDDLKQYESLGPEGNATVPSPEQHEDLEKYRTHIADEKWSGRQIETSAPPEDLHQYRPTVFEDVVSNDHPFQQYGDLDKYKSFRSQHQEAPTHPDEDAVIQSLQEFDLKEKNHTVPAADDMFAPGDLYTPGTLPKMDLPEGHIFSKHYVDNASSKASASPDKNLGELNRQMSEYCAASDAIDREMNESVQRARHDFSEGQDVERQDKYTDIPALGKGIQDSIPIAEEEGCEVHPHAGKSVPIEPAMDRCPYPRAKNAKRSEDDGRAIMSNQEQTIDGFSMEPQGLETAYTRECGGRQTMPIYTTAYGSKPKQDGPQPESLGDGLSWVPTRSFYFRDPEIDGLPRSKSEELSQRQETSRAEEPTIYKILAYDPTMQSVNVAETTSVVPEHASPLSPTEVLPRLTHPEKFLPYFAGLKAEGFEIVSGSGDMLVFCQIRPASTAASDNVPRVNPIDMMGRATALPNAAAFASPTGFVNYDVPRVEEPPTEAPFRSNIDVRREEPVFSGPKFTENEQRKNNKKWRMGNRVLLGGAWVAGLSYAIGVVSDYFTTGGADGKGPSGFSPR